MLPRELYERMVAHARAEFPNEACGVVAGQVGTALEVYEMQNAEASPVVYRFDEREQLRVFNDVGPTRLPWRKCRRTLRPDI